MVLLYIGKGCVLDDVKNFYILEEGDCFVSVEESRDEDLEDIIDGFFKNFDFYEFEVSFELILILKLFDYGIRCCMMLMYDL